MNKLVCFDQFPTIKSLCFDVETYNYLSYWQEDSLLHLEALLNSKKAMGLADLFQFLASFSLRRLEEKKHANPYLYSHFTSIQTAFKEFCYEAICNIIQASLISDAESRFGIKPPPEPFLLFPDKSKRPPNAPGVYFLWDGSTVDYVGRAASLVNRLSPSHHVLRPGHGVSWIELKRSQTINTEYLYIGLLNPPKNKVGAIR